MARVYMMLLLTLRGNPIIYQGEVIGVTTSAGYGYTVRKTICYGYLPADREFKRDAFEIESYRQTFTARLEPTRAIYDPDRKKILI